MIPHKKIRYRLEGYALAAAFFLFRSLGVERASALGGWIGRTIGPRLSASRKAARNIKNAFPDQEAAFVKKTVCGMWDNLGRVIAEYPHLREIVQHHLVVEGAENLKIFDKGPVILIGGHLANWELDAFFFNEVVRYPVSCIVREPNNPYAAALIAQCRAHSKTDAYIAKSSAGMRQLVQTLKNGQSIGILIDQKYNQGIAAPFMGRPAMTSSAFAQLARRFNAPILPVRTERLEGCQFRIVIDPPFSAEEESDLDLIKRAHAHLERWIHEKPEQWLWLHRRWDSAALKSMD